MGDVLVSRTSSVSHRLVPPVRATLKDIRSTAIDPKHICVPDSTNCLCPKMRVVTQCVNIETMDQDAFKHLQDAASKPVLFGNTVGQELVPIDA